MSPLELPLELLLLLHHHPFRQQGIWKQEVVIQESCFFQICSRQLNARKPTTGGGIPVPLAQQLLDVLADKVQRGEI